LQADPNFLCKFNLDFAEKFLFVLCFMPYVIFDVNFKPNFLSS
jgi:hypothetical protein